eukprot:Filipodium_phascolosomae@DN4923_c0_g1_i1.p1
MEKYRKRFMESPINSSSLREVGLLLTGGGAGEWERFCCAECYHMGRRNERIRQSRDKYEGEEMLTYLPSRQLPWLGRCEFKVEDMTDIKKEDLRTLSDWIKDLAVGITEIDYDKRLLLYESFHKYLQGLIAESDDRTRHDREEYTKAWSIWESFKGWPLDQKQAPQTEEALNKSTNEYLAAVGHDSQREMKKIMQEYDARELEAISKIRSLEMTGPRELNR